MTGLRSPRHARVLAMGIFTIVAFGGTRAVTADTLPLAQSQRAVLSTRLIAAVRRDDAQGARRLLDEGANVNTRHQNGTTPLMAACREASDTMVRLLLSRGADVRLQDNGGLSALGYASLHPAIVDLLVSRGAKATPTDVAEFRTSLVGALVLDSGWEDADMMRQAQLSLRMSVSPNAQDDYGQTLLSIAVENDRAIAIRFLLQKGAVSNRPDRDGQTPLMRAVSKNIAYTLPGTLPQTNTSLARLLLEGGANPNLREHKTGQTALHAAAAMSRPDMVRLLLKHGAMMDARDNLGQTPLMLAAHAGESSNVAALLEAGANPKLRDKDGKSARDYANEPVVAPTLYWLEPLPNLPATATQKDYEKAFREQQQRRERDERDQMRRLQQGRTKARQMLLKAETKR